MGMFDKRRFLTGDDGYVEAGDTFWLHNAKIDGTTEINGRERKVAKLLVSRTRDGEQATVFTSGAGITRQVGDMDAGDRAALPMEVRLDEIPSDKGNPTKVLNPATEPPSVAPSTSDW